MKAVIFTEEAKTVAKDADDLALIDYFKGQFRPVTTLVKELSEVSDTDVYIFSDEYGLCEGRMSISEAEQMNRKGNLQKDAQEAIRNSIPEADIVIILLTKDIFSSVVEPIWDEIVESTKQDSIWGLGLSQGAIDTIDIEPLREKSDLYVYRRSGVARLGTETRDQLLSAVRSQDLK